MTLLPSTLVPQWFIEKRALALSLMTLGGVTASAVFPPLNTFMIDSWGWNITWRFWAILLWLVYVPSTLILTRNKPEDIGLLPDNRMVRPTDQVNIYEKEPLKEKAKPEESWTLQEAMKTHAFWLMMFCQAVPSMIMTGVTFHLISILSERGLSHTLAAMVLSIVAIYLPNILLNSLPYLMLQTGGSRPIPAVCADVWIWR